MHVPIKHLELKYRSPLPPFLQPMNGVDISTPTAVSKHRFSRRIPCPLPPRLRLMSLVRPLQGWPLMKSFREGSLSVDLLDDEFQHFMVWEKRRILRLWVLLFLPFLPRIQSKVPLSEGASLRPVFLAPSCPSRVRKILQHTPVWDFLGLPFLAPGAQRLTSCQGLQVSIIPGNLTSSFARSECTGQSSIQRRHWFCLSLGASSKERDTTVAFGDPL